MRQADLEMYRWKIHNLTKPKKNKRHSGCSWRMYWSECGAFVSILPRQSGKTEMIFKMAKSIVNKETREDYLIVLRSSSFRSNMRYCIDKIGVDYKKVITLGASLSLINCSNINLFVDEFDFLDERDLRALIDRPWKSVTMISTIRT